MAQSPMIRAIEVGDAEAVAAMIRTAFAAIEAPLDPAPSALRVDAAAIRAHLEPGGGALLPGAGCVLWSVKARGLYIGRLAVLPMHRGRGLALRLLDAAEAEARRLGLPRVHLEVRLALAGNRRLFARAGFVEAMRRAHPGYDHDTFVEAEKLL